MNVLCLAFKPVLLFGMVVAVASAPTSCGGLPSDNSPQDELVPDDPAPDDPAQDDPGQADPPSSDGERPAGWSEETHSNDADPNYDVIFAEGEVKRLDITIAPEDWQAMQDDMTDIYGESGQGGGPPPPGGFDGPPPRPDPRTLKEVAEASQPVHLPPPEAFAACEGRDEGDDCTVLLDGMAPPGVCVPWDEDELVCVPEDGPGGPGGGGMPFESRNPIYVPCTVEFEGKTWWYVGIRFKGQSTLMTSWMSGIGKLPLRFDFDEFEDEHPEIDNQRFYGFKRLALANNSHDPSLLREKVAHDIFRDAGVPAPRTAFYRVYVDFGEGFVYFGLYTMTEIPDDPMFETQFGDDDGNLYKPEGFGATWIAFDEESFPKKTNESEEDWSDIESAIAALHADQSDPAEWRAGLEATLNVDEFIHWLAVNTVIQNWDTYGNMTQNYYLYSDPADDWRLYWIPWDNNEAMKSGFAGAPGQPLSLELDEVDDGWPLIRYLMDDPVYRAVYVSYVEQTIEGAFAVAPTQDRLLAAHDLIAPYVVGPDGEQPGYTILMNPQQFEVELDGLLDHVVQRREAALLFLESSP